MRSRSPQKREGRENLSRHEKEDKQRAEPSPADRPLLEIHVFAASCKKTDAEREQSRRRDEEERHVQFASSWLAGSNQ
jgi:hypothetical protein